MSELLVYHGSTQVVENPSCSKGRNNLDFGKGFYVTNRKEQAIQWAKLAAQRQNLPAYVNCYVLDKEKLLSEARCKIFTSYNEEWLSFIVANRQGLDWAKEYDYIEGGVANDRVIDTVNLYIAGLMDIQTALGRLSQHQPNNQICILNQNLLNQYLKFKDAELI